MSMRGEKWNEYREIERAAEACEGNARASINAMDPDYPNEAMQEATVAVAEATLAVAARLEALTYAIRHHGS